jgi:U3 small nucleolar RNA-associated protein 15
MASHVSAAATMNEFKPSSHLQTKKPTAMSVTSMLPGAVFNLHEGRYWADTFGLGPTDGPVKKFAHPRAVTLQAGQAAVVHQLAFGPIGSGKNSSTSVPLAVASGPRVRLYGTSPQSTFHRTLMRHKIEKGEKEDVVVSADRQVVTGGTLAMAVAYRHDGRLLAVGTDAGKIRIADATSRATLATFSSPNSLSIRAVQWFRDGQRLLAAGDDAVARCYKLAHGATSSNKQTTLALVGHGDAIRCAILWQASTAEKLKNAHFPTAVAATGSYDHTVRLWNLDDDVDGDRMDDDNENDDDDAAASNRCMSVLSHGSPVEALLWMPSSDPTVPVWLVSAGGTTVKVWNPATGVCVCTVDTHHRKSITCLLTTVRTNPETEQVSVRILTGGLDGLIRIHSWDGATGKLEHLHGLKLAYAVTALAVNAKGDRLAIGTTTGRVLVRQKGASIQAHKRKREPLAGTYSFFTRGMNSDAVAGDYVAENPNGKKQKLRTFDQALKQFRYGDALDEALGTRNPLAVVAIMEELGKRRGLTIALSNRDEESLEPILSFTARYISRPRFAALLIGVADKLIDIYGDVAGQSEMIDELFEKLKKQVKDESRAQKLLFRVVGQLDAILTAAEMDEGEY